MSASKRRVGFTFPAPFDALWSFRRRPATDLNVVKGARAAIVWHSNPGAGAIIQAGRYLGWIVRFPKELVQQVIVRGQVADILKIALANGVMPRDYYLGNLARHGGTRVLLDYVPYHVYEPVAVYLSIDRSAETVALARDKRTFELRCRDAGLPVVRTIAVAEDGGLRTLAGDPCPESLPPQDLFLKPSRSTQGIGIERWRHLPDGHYADSGGRSLSVRDLLARCAHLAEVRGSPLLVQECLGNSPELRNFAGSALATTRVVTMINENGEPEIVEAFYRTSIVPEAVADNFHQGGLIFPIEVDTGVLWPGFGDLSYALPLAMDHPETGAKMAGVILPGWPAVSELALKAHRAFQGLLIAGWDVAFTSEGPVLIETNIPPGISVRRQGASETLTGTRLLALLAFHAGTWLDSVAPPDSRWRCRESKYSGRAVQVIKQSDMGHH